MLWFTRRESVLPVVSIEMRVWDARQSCRETGREELVGGGSDLGARRSFDEQCESLRRSAGPSIGEGKEKPERPDFQAIEAASYHGLAWGGGYNVEIGLAGESGRGGRKGRERGERQGGRQGNREGGGREAMCGEGGGGWKGEGGRMRGCEGRRRERGKGREGWKRGEGGRGWRGEGNGGSQGKKDGRTLLN